MKKYHLLLLSVLSGFLFTFSWPADGFPGLLFLAFIPLFFIEDYINRHRSKFHLFSVMFYSYPAFVIWTSLTTWWIWNSTPGGGVAAVLANALFMAFTLNLFHITRRFVFSPRQAQLVFVFFWITFEYIHLNWDLNWPWLNLGNGFANYVKWIQWYEFTGTFGGTLWILLVNIFFYRALQECLDAKRMILKSKLFIIAGCVFIIVPLIISMVKYSSYEEIKRPISIILVQPNINPYTEQYNLPPYEVIHRNFSLADSLIDPETDLVACPESAIQEPIWERNMQYYPTFGLIKKYINQHPNIGVIIGASTRKEFMPGEEVSETARKFTDVDKYYDAYNTAFYFDTTNITQWSHKSKLTPGVERMPFPKYMKFLESFAIDLGGTVGSLGTDEERIVFVRASDSLKFGAAICYESIFGEFFAEFVNNGAELMFVVTNDGWWGNTSGHRQHVVFARLRAIETRRSIARSANTGISCFVNQRGDIFQKTKYWVPAVIKQNLNANKEITFYTTYGDYIARISAFITVILLLYTIASAVMRKRKLGYNHR